MVCDLASLKSLLLLRTRRSSTSTPLGLDETTRRTSGMTTAGETNKMVSPPPDLMQEYVETAKERRQEERLKNVNLDDWLPITSSRNAK
ncbi:hypothetical protein PR202_ga03580 [Eleusine coracana subsp. coracana]|uniref:Uncharacterized protein n=1 Tax=Eleusine coracana subsp. coracana TaxID=191504 RepID=A0AAV5BPP0_ELECO|nr:hypothetical protein PR202_ga03580 [Eleusine coracana subsp. coracana]